MEPVFMRFCGFYRVKSSVLPVLRFYLVRLRRANPLRACNRQRLVEVLFESMMVRGTMFRAMRNPQACERYSANFPFAGLLIG
jgi:hypothetical protein